MSQTKETPFLMEETIKKILEIVSRNPEDVVQRLKAENEQLKAALAVAKNSLQQIEQLPNEEAFKRGGIAREALGVLNNLKI